MAHRGFVGRYGKPEHKLAGGGVPGDPVQGQGQGQEDQGSLKQLARGRSPPGPPGHPSKLVRRGLCASGRVETGRALLSS